jgi:predicted nucleotidyltransferase
MLDLARDTVFVTLSGSQAYGTARAGSDVDLRGVCVAPLELRVSPFRKFEQFEGTLDGPLWSALEPKLREHATARFGLGVKVEAVVFDVAKFLLLCASANPNALEVLFADERDWVYATPAWERIHRERRRFLSREVQQTYLGYALSQLKRIRSHRSWLLTPPQKKPLRSDFGLPEANTLSSEDVRRLEPSIAERAFSRDVLALLDAERQYRAAVRQWDAYQAWRRERNAGRAELERRFGYDTKHAMHLVRLMRTGLELLSTGELLVRRNDAAELLAIRDGALSFEELEALARRLELEMQAAVEVTRLPPAIDRDFVERLAIETILAARPD